MKKKVRIKGLPTGQSGLEVKMDHLRAGLGFNANVMPWPIMAGKMSAPPIKVNSKLQPVAREGANLEAEKDEVAMIPGQGGIPDTYTIGGKRHTQGGTPLNLPENSFIFSDTAKMRIKDPVVLAQFGMPERKSGYTPAEIAKKYNTAPFKKILADKNTDELQRETAELMLTNYNLKLAKLALIQESMKGFPQGIPEIALPYIESMGINPEDLLQQNPGAPENAEDAAGQESAMEIGGPVMAQQPGAPLQYLKEGGPDYFAQTGIAVKQQSTPGWDGNIEDEQSFAKTYKDDYEAYINALKSGDPMTMINTAKELDKRASTATGPMSWKFVPGSDANKFTDLSAILYERAAPKKQVAKKEKSKEEKAKDAAEEIYKKLNKVYTDAPVGPEKLKAKTALDEFKGYASRTPVDYPGDVDEYGIQMPSFKVMYTGKEMDYINQKQKELFPEQYNTPAATTSPSSKTGVKEAGMQNIQGVPTTTMSFEEYKKSKGYKKYGGTTKKVKITGLPSMAYGGLQKFQGDVYGSQYNGIPANSPLMQPGVQLDFNNPNYAAQAAINDNYRLDATIPADSPLMKPAAKLDFTSSDTTKPTNAENKNLAYKDTQVKWGPKYGISGPATAQGIITGMDFISSLGRNKEMLALEQKMKEQQFSMFTPEAGTKGSWVQTGMGSGLIDPNSNIIQQPGYMTMRRNTFGYPRREYGGAIDTFKLGGYTTVNGQGGAYDSDNPTVFIPMSRADYDSITAQEKATTSKPATGGTKKPAQESTIGVYTPEWTKYLTELAKSSGMSIDDPRFKAKLPSYFFDEKTGKLKSKAELEKLARAASTQKQLGSGSFGEEYWEGAYKDDFLRRHKTLIDQFEKEHPGEKFDPTKLDLKGGKESSHMKWFQEAYNKMAKEKGAPQYDFGQANKFGRLSYSVPSFEDFGEEKPEETKTEAGPATTTTEDKTKGTVPADVLKYKHLAQPRIKTPAFGWTIQDMNNLGRAVGSFFRTQKHMPWEATPSFYQAETVFDDPTRRIAAINESRNIAAQNMAGFTNPQAFAANFMAMNNLGDVSNAIADVHSRNIGIANQRDAYNAQALNAFDQERANRDTRLYDKNTMADVAYEAEKEAKRDVIAGAFNTGMKNAADIYNLNQLYPQYAVNPLFQTMYHKNPRDLKPKYEQQKDLAKSYNDILSTYKNLNETPEGRKVAYEAAKQQLGIASTPEDPFLEYQRARNYNQIPQYNPYGYGEES